MTHDPHRVQSKVVKEQALWLLGVIHCVINEGPTRAALRFAGASPTPIHTPEYGAVGLYRSTTTPVSFKVTAEAPSRPSPGTISTLAPLAEVMPECRTRARCRHLTADTT